MTTSILTREDRVAEFRAAANKGTITTQPEEMAVVWGCLSEEMIELAEAAQEYHNAPTPQNRANFVKEWADSQYVLSQIAVFYEIPAQAAFDRVADNNMTKVVDGKIILREDGKILKPEGYQPADMQGL